MIKRLFMGILVVPILICSSLQPVSATTLYSDLTTLKNGSTALQAQASVQNLPGDSVLSPAESIQASIDELKKAIDQDNLSLEQHKQTIAQLNAEQQTLVTQQKKDSEALGNFVKNQYVEGDNPNLTYFSWLVSSRSIDDLITRSTYVNAILKYYRELRIKVAANSEAIKAKQTLEQAETEKLMAEIQSKQLLSDGLSVALAKQNELTNSITNADALSRGQQASTEPVKLNGQVGQLLSFASNYLGVPYTWGGTYPQFDCSSYVQYVYGHFGINLGRVTWDQYGQGQSVSRDSLRAGDLVFFSTYQAGPSHVGIYVGDGMMINSSNSGVSYASINSPYWSSKFVGARRVSS